MARGRGGTGGLQLPPLPSPLLTFFENYKELFELLRKSVFSPPPVHFEFESLVTAFPPPPPAPFQFQNSSAVPELLDEKRGRNNKKPIDRSRDVVPSERKNEK